MNNNKALISMVLGIAGGLMTFFLMGTVVYIISAALGIAAIVLSVMAKKEIANNKNSSGKGMAIAGMILGIANLVLVVIMVLGLYMISNIEIASAAYCPKEMNMVNQCVDNHDGTADCVYMDVLETHCYTEVLDESQYK